jgi:PTH1 family peptidyl-tRNA hydrolase
MKLIVGLGNPGEAYKQNRHNIGFMIVDAFARNQHLVLRKEKRYDYYHWKEGLFILPKTYMNRSGSAILSARSNHKIEDTLIIVDDLNLDFGVIRIRNSGGNGGHNGLKSIEEAIGSNAYKRIRVGIGYSSAENFTEHVLGNFSEKENDLLKKVFELTNQLLRIYSEENFDETLKYYSKMKSTYSKEIEIP